MTNRRYAVGGISQASNSFSGLVANMGDFVARGGYLERGRTIPPANRGTDTVMGGFLAELDVHGDEAVPTLNGYACPGGPLDLHTYEKLRDELVYRIAGAPPLDGVLLALHGAMLADRYADPEGDILQHLRELLGVVPIAIVLDPRANVSEGMVELADVMVVAKTNGEAGVVPTIAAASGAALRGTARRVGATFGAAATAGATAARHLRAVVEDGLRVHKVCVQLPLLVPGFRPGFIAAANADDPWRRLERRAVDTVNRDPRVLELAVVAGFPYADTPWSCGGVLACSTISESHARQAAVAMADALWNERHALLREGQLPGPALTRALQSGGPTILNDVADDPSSGGPGDTTSLLRLVLERDPEGAFVGVVHDPETTAQAFTVGEGEAGEFAIGGKMRHEHGEPVVVQARVEKLSDGIFVRSGPFARGKEDVLGRSALLRVGRVLVAVSDGRASANDAALLRMFGIEPTEAKLLVLKARGPLRVALGVPDADEVEAEAPGAAPSDVTQLPFVHLVRPIFPLDHDVGRTDVR